jgi:hypothetical protein
MPGLKNYRRFAQELKNQDFRHLEQIIQILEDEEHKPGFGVFKETLWIYLKKAHLNEHQKRRLRNAAIGYLNRRMTRDFWAMAKFVSRIASDELRNRVKDLTHSEDGKVRTRALLLWACLQGPELGARVRYNFKYTHRVEDVWAILSEDEKKRLQ